MGDANNDAVEDDKPSARFRFIATCLPRRRVRVVLEKGMLAKTRSCDIKVLIPRIFARRMGLVMYSFYNEIVDFEKAYVFQKRVSWRRHVCPN